MYIIVKIHVLEIEKFCFYYGLIVYLLFLLFLLLDKMTGGTQEAKCLKSLVYMTDGMNR